MPTQMFEPKIIIQERLDRVAIMISSYTVDFGSMTTEYVAKIIETDPAIKEEIEGLFGIKYDSVTYYERQQPPDTSDIELYYEGKKVLGISLKTTTTKNILRPIRSISRILMPGEIGAIAFPVKVVKNGKEDIRIIIVIFDRGLIKRLSPIGIYEQIFEELDKKRKNEDFDYIGLINLNRAGIIKALAEAHTAKTIMNTTKEIATEAKEEARKAKEIAMQILEVMLRLEKKIESKK